MYTDTRRIRKTTTITCRQKNKKKPKNQKKQKKTTSQAIRDEFRSDILHFMFILFKIGETRN